MLWRDRPIFAFDGFRISLCIVAFQSEAFSILVMMIAFIFDAFPAAAKIRCFRRMNFFLQRKWDSLKMKRERISQISSLCFKIWYKPEVIRIILGSVLNLDWQIEVTLEDWDPDSYLWTDWLVRCFWTLTAHLNCLFCVASGLNFDSAVFWEVYLRHRHHHRRHL